MAGELAQLEELKMTKTRAKTFVSQIKNETKLQPTIYKVQACCRMKIIHDELTHLRLHQRSKVGSLNDCSIIHT